MTDRTWSFTNGWGPRFIRPNVHMLPVRLTSDLSLDLNQFRCPNLRLNQKRYLTSLHYPDWYMLLRPPGPLSPFYSDHDRTPPWTTRPHPPSKSPVSTVPLLPRPVHLLRFNTRFFSSHRGPFSPLHPVSLQISSLKPKISTL